LYMAILWPSAAGKLGGHILFDTHDPKHPKRYIQNAGLDLNKDGLITKEEAATKVRQMLEKGLASQNVLT
jgi:hypothetical protein